MQLKTCKKSITILPSKEPVSRMKEQAFVTKGRGQPGSRRHIGIIDDSQTHLVQLRALLSRIPQVTVETFERATSEVLDYIEFRADLVIIDNMMPVVSGMEFLRLLRARPSLKFIPVMMLTSAQDNATRWSALDEGVTSFKTKPINQYDLRTTVERLLPPPECIG